jgi:PAS domain S-box-containing protein
MPISRSPEELSERIARSESRYQSLVAAMTSVVWETNATGEFVDVQEPWASYTGQTWKEYRDRGWLNAVHPGDRRKVTAEWLKAVNGGLPAECEARVFSKRHGGYRYTVTRGVPVFSVKGKVEGWLGTLTDVHDQRVAEQRNHLMLTLNDRVSHCNTAQEIVGIMTKVLGEGLKVTRCVFILTDVEEDRFEIIDGYHPGLNDQSGCYEVPLSANPLIKLAAANQVVVVNDVLTDPRTVPDYESEYKRWEFRAVMLVPIIRDGKLRGMLAPSDQKPREWTPEEQELAKETADRTWLAVQNLRATQEIRALNEALEKRVLERTADLEEANRELEGFTYTVSHDIRGPLRAIMSSSMILIEDFSASLPRQAQELVERQALAAKRLGVLIDDVLNFSRLGRTEMKKSEIDFTSLVEKVAAEVLPHESINIQPKMVAYGDPSLVQLVVQNVLENSKKFASKEKPLAVRVQHDGATFSIADNGIGFEPEYSEKIFAPFERLHHEEAYAGTGIGLANVKRIIERHGGRVWAKSALGKGATICFTLPEAGP